jgi:hypothetical protein
MNEEFLTYGLVVVVVVVVVPSISLLQLDYHVWGHIKNMVYEHDVDIREEMFLMLQDALIMLQFFVGLHVP